MTSVSQPSPARKVPADTSDTKTRTTHDNSNDIFTADSCFNATSIADKLSEYVTYHLEKGVEKLPMLDQDSSMDKKLLQRLEKTYLKNIDVFEIFVARNIFSLNKFPPKRRQAIIEAFQSDKEFNDADMGKDGENIAANEETESKDLPTNVPKSPSDIPTEQQMADLTKEVERLRMELTKAKETKKNLIRSLKEIEVAEQLADLAGTKVVAGTTVAGESPSSSSPSCTMNNVVTTMEQSHGLKQLHQHGDGLIKRMEDEKRERQEAGKDDDGMLTSVVVKKRKKRNNMQTIDERFAEDKKSFGVMSKSVLGNIQKLIAPQNKENA